MAARISAALVAASAVGMGNSSISVPGVIGIALGGYEMIFNGDGIPFDDKHEHACPEDSGVACQRKGKSKS
jgi:hypothetical protein